MTWLLVLICFSQNKRSGSNFFIMLHAESNKWIINSAKQANYQIKWRVYGHLLTSVPANWTWVQLENGSKVVQSWPHPSLFTVCELLEALLRNVAKAVHTSLNVKSICCCFHWVSRFPVWRVLFIVREVMEPTWALIGTRTQGREFKPSKTCGILGFKAVWGQWGVLICGSSAPGFHGCCVIAWRLSYPSCWGGLSWIPPSHIGKRVFLSSRFKI